MKIQKKWKKSERENIEVYWQAPRGIIALLSCSTVELVRVYQKTDALYHLLEANRQSVYEHISYVHRSQ